MTTATQKQLDYINSMIASLENPEYYNGIEAKMKETEGAAYQMYEGQVMMYYAGLLNIRLRRNPITLAELKSQTVTAITALRNQIAAGISTSEASAIIDLLKQKRLV